MSVTRSGTSQERWLKSAVKQVFSELQIKTGEIEGLTLELVQNSNCSCGTALFPHCKSCASLLGWIGEELGTTGRPHLPVFRVSSLVACWVV